MIKVLGIICLLTLSSFTSYTDLLGEDPNSKLKVGDIAPNFTANDSNGNTFSLKEELAKGPVVLMFYRGYWCSYCNRQLSALQDSLQFIKDKGATVIAITTETIENIDMTIEKTGATIPIFHDDSLKIINAYGVPFEVDDATVNRYKIHLNIDLEKINGENGIYLPIPATYIIRKDGTISYLFYNTDYKKRASVAEIIDNL